MNKLCRNISRECNTGQTTSFETIKDVEHFGFTARERQNFEGKDIFSKRKETGLKPDLRPDKLLLGSFVQFKPVEIQKTSKQKMNLKVERRVKSCNDDESDKFNSMEGFSNSDRLK